MTLRAPSPHAVKLEPMRPSAAVRTWYERELMMLVVGMCVKTGHALVPIYKSAPEPILPMTFPIGEMNHALDLLEAEWSEVFDSRANDLAFGLAFRVLRHHDLAMSKSLKAVGIQPPVVEQRGDSASIAFDDAKSAWPKWKDFVIKFDFTSRMRDTVQACLRDNVDLISNRRIKNGPAIPKKFFGEIRKMAQQSIERGRDVVGFTDDLEDRFGITRRRASLIARDQNNKMTAAFHRTRQLGLGITKAVWIETYASLHPREDTHGAFASGEDGGPVYNIEDGVDFDDGMGPVVPGEAVNCECFSQSIIQGYED